MLTRQEWQATQQPIDIRMKASNKVLTSTTAFTTAELGALPSVKVISNCSEAQLIELIDELNQANQPLLLIGFANAWPIVNASKAGLNGLQSYLKGHQLSTENDFMVGTGKIPSEHGGRLFYNQDFTGFNFTRQGQAFSEFLKELFDNSSNAESDVQRYLGSTKVDMLFPALRDDGNDIKVLNDYSPLINMWMSNQTQVAAHQDLPHNLAVCVAGKRRFTLFPPEQIDNLYIGPLDLTPAGQAISLVNHQAPDFDAHPKYKEALAHAQVAELDTGDALLLPSLWWHSVESLDALNILINYWWQPTTQNCQHSEQQKQRRANQASGAPMDALLHAFMNIRHLPVNQKDAIKALFDYYVFNEQSPNEQFEHIPEQARGLLNSQDEIAIRKLRAMLLNKLNQ